MQTLSTQETHEDIPHDECGVFGVWAPGEDVSKLAYFGLFALQDRGQFTTTLSEVRERADLLAGLDELERLRPDVRALRWMTEELRVSLFAQQLGTAHAVSEKRIYAAMDAVEKALEQSRGAGR